MLFPIIKVKSSCSKSDIPHIVGSNSHDRLYIKDNAIHYLNMQSFSGTKNADGQGYHFDGDTSEFLGSDELAVEFLSLEEIIELAMKSMETDTEYTLKINEMMKLFLSKREENQKKVKESEERTGIRNNTSGSLF